MNVLPDPTAPALPGTTLPAYTATQGFHLGQLAALRGALKAMIDPPADGAQTPQAQLEQAVQECWARYIRSTAATPAEAAALEAAGLPAQIRIDPKQEIPVAVWPEASQPLTDAWGLFVVPALDPAHHTPLRIATLFQPVDVKGLPEGTQTVLLRDARHVATAVIVEILSSQVGDTARQLEAISATEGWKRLQALGTWYKQASIAALQHLPIDQLRDWSDVPGPVLAATEWTDAARVVASHGRTVLAQKALALQMAATNYRLQLDRAELANPRDLEKAAGVMVLALQGQRGVLANQLDGLNRAYAETLKIDPEIVDARIVFAPNPRDLPQMALIPRSARIAPTLLHRD